VDAHGAKGSVFFEPGKLGGLEKMRFTTARRVEGSYSGRHVAKRRGGAGEFVDYREYAPGDDLRRLDWKAMGRTGRSYLKLYQDETDLRCTLVLDCSGSMAQGSRSRTDTRGSKLEWMQYFATALSHLIILGRDAVGMCVVREKVDNFLTPVASVAQRALIHRAIERLRPDGETDLAGGLDSLLLQSSRRGVLMVVSDFLVPNLEPVISSVRKFRARGWEIITLHLVHPHEEKLPAGNAFRFLGQEGESSVNCQVAEIRKAYEERFQSHLKATRTALFSAGCDYYRVSTSESYLDVLRSFLVMRST
jgi:uncharacterized protein (DUF58 family)